MKTFLPSFLVTVLHTGAQLPIKWYYILFLLVLSLGVFGQSTLRLKKQTFELHNVTGEILRFEGKKVLKIERDLNAIPFDLNNLEATVDEPHYAKLIGLSDFENGTIEIKMLSKLQDPAPYPGIAGFIGIFFRVNEDDTAFESIYLRPKVGRVNDQGMRNRTVQYFSYPHAKFATLRQSAPGKYEGPAPVALNEWITMRVEVNGQTAEMYINNMKHSSFVVDRLLGANPKGSIGLYVDIGTVGYFRDLKVRKKELKATEQLGEKIDGI
ncbi:hypothetical protein QWY85_11380 [Neolewinella lacunae]|uniref:3-keto-alpha-glucoside-1,2-lyase/3-keto-2-hydroxy-glucal hydratase domain-containing protein n=1 Tax=Neolewinella lacunae TaxID=1517758 RepID=A0A923PL90_9BACT|nr:family 16 glycoside hydrolase [Neolewinella lacunae]MBC6993736.1 hypothetical protein [Neolewinella lacunae]MDN3635263.1 hypothetical protein [Neolewinella lacunae]